MMKENSLEEVGLREMNHSRLLKSRRLRKKTGRMLKIEGRAQGQRK
jgi:hypothetical protein